MADKGYDFEDPRGPHEDSASELGAADVVPDEEIDLAVADLECKQSVNYFGVWAAVETAYQEEIIANNEEWFADILELQDARVANAKRLVAEYE